MLAAVAMASLALAVQDSAKEPSEPRTPQAHTRGRAEEPAGEAAGASWGALEEIRSLEGGGDVDGARARLAALLEGDEYRRLLASEHEAVLTRLSALERAARSLNAPELQAVVQRERVDRLSARLAPEDPQLLAAQQGLAATLFVLRDVAGARRLFEQVLEQRERALPPDHPDLLNAKVNLGAVLSASGDLAEALELAEEVRAVREQLLPEDHPDRLMIETNVAIGRMQLGDLRGAVELLEHVRPRWPSPPDADPAGLLYVEQALAAARWELGDLEEAFDLLTHVRASFARTLPADHPDLLTAEFNLAVLRSQLGDAAGALEIFERICAARERDLPADHPDILLAKQNLAATLRRLGEPERALALDEYVHAAQERSLPPDHPDLLAAKYNLAVGREWVGDAQGAAELLEEVCDARARLLPPDHPHRSAAELSLGTARYRLGDLEGALELFERVYATRRRVFPEGHPDRLLAAENLAVARRRLADGSGAREATLALLREQRKRLSDLRVESPRVARFAALEELHRFSKALFAAGPAGTADQDMDRELFAVLSGLRLVSTTSRAVALAAARSSELRSARERVSDTRRRLNDLALSPPSDAASLASWRDELVAVARRRDELERDLRSTLSADVFASLPSAELVARGLARDAAFVSYLRYSRLAEDALDPPVDSLLAFVVEPDATVHRLELGPSWPIEDLVERWRTGLGAPTVSRADASAERTGQRGVGVERGAPPDTGERALGEALRERLLDPCLAELGEPRPHTVHVVLDDYLHLLPLDALPLEEGRLGDAIGVVLETSAQRLIEPPDRSTASGILVAVGAVDFDAALGGPGASATEFPWRVGSRARFEPLPETGPEVELLTRSYESRFGPERLEPVVLEGAAATKRALTDLAPRARFLHVATHGWFAPEDVGSMIDGIEEAATRELVSRADSALRGFAPETLCGLAFAGANGGAGELGDVSGILTAEELAALDLSRCELAVLSACETNVGLRRAGQGIQSLQSALHTAGARTAVTSLWRVDDRAARRLMETFYARLWRDGLGTAEALWGAKTLLRDEGHPLRDWAGWVLTGRPD